MPVLLPVRDEVPHRFWQFILISKTPAANDKGGSFMYTDAIMPHIFEFSNLGGKRRVDFYQTNGIFIAL